MKYLIFLATITLSLSVASISKVSALETSRKNTTSTRINNSVFVAEAKVSGQFVTVEKNHLTKGAINIIEENGKQYIEFGDDFKTVEGPDVEIILHKNSSVPVNINEENYVTIAPIQSLEGKQRYAIPEAIDLNEYASVAVWCQQFNVTFGYAPL